MLACVQAMLILLSGNAKQADPKNATPEAPAASGPLKNA